MKVLRVLGGIFWVCMFIWCILIYEFAGILNIGTETLMAMSIWFLFTCIFEKRIKKSLKKKKAGRFLLTAYRVVLTAGILIVLLESNLMLAATMNKPADNSTLVVLGSQVKRDGPSLMTALRLEAAREYLINNPDSVAVLSGGQGANEPWSEAKGMADYLVLHGIPASRLYLEDASTSTRENMKYSMELIKREGLNKNIAIVTNAFHIYRAGRIAEREGIDYSVLPAKSFYFILPSYYIRELYAILADWVLY